MKKSLRAMVCVTLAGLLLFSGLNLVLGVHVAVEHSITDHGHDHDPLPTNPGPDPEDSPDHRHELGAVENPAVTRGPAPIAPVLFLTGFFSQSWQAQPDPFAASRVFQSSPIPPDQLRRHAVLLI